MKNDKNQPSLFSDEEMENLSLMKKDYQDDIDKKMKAEEKKERKKNDSSYR